MNRALATILLAAAVWAPGASTASAKPFSARRAPVATTDVDRILGGNPATDGTLTMVARITDHTSAGTRLCSGTVVSPTLVLTAAHCATDPAAADYQVQTGSESLAAPSQLSAVRRVIVDPAYDAAAHDDDAALLALSTPSTATPVTLATVPPPAGTTGVLTGWGIDDAAGDVAPTLQQGSTTVQDPDTCGQMAAAADAAFDPADELCTVDTAGAVGACEGDSGGPLLSTGGAGWVQLAIVSWGAAGCTVTFPDYFTRVDAVAGWVDAQIVAASGTPTPSPTVIAAAPSPRAGTYRGQTTQHRAIRLQITGARTAMRAARLTVTARCSRRPHATATVALRRPVILALHGGLGFDARSGGRRGPRVQWQGTFSAAGRAAGRVTVSWTSRRDGACRSGPVGWHAAR